MNDLFAVATRMKYRFPFRGSLSVEDLWDLHPMSLDKIYQVLVKDLGEVTGESLLAVSQKRTEKQEIENKIELVKFIVGVKLAEAAEEKESRDRAERKEKLLGVLALKEQEELASLSTEELRKMVEDL